MAFCSKCGAQLADGAQFCPSCGAKVGEPAPQQTQSNAPVDSTSDFDAKDIEANKVMSILAYLGILVLVPIFAAKESKFARYHANQGLILCIASVVYGITYSILSSILLAISWRLYAVVSVLGFLSLVFLVLCIIGIVNAASGKAKELPVIGKFRILN